MLILKFFLGLHYIAQYGVIALLCALAVLAIVKIPGKAGAFVGAALFTLAGFAVAYNMGFRDRGTMCKEAELTTKLKDANELIEWQAQQRATLESNIALYKQQVDGLNVLRMKDALDLMTARKALADMALADPKDANGKPSPIILRAVRGK